MKVSNLLREPLVHFMMIGAALFALYGAAGGSDSDDSERRIVVSAGRIEQLANIFAKTWQRPPRDDELKGLVDDFVLEELYYRQALAMGLDRDDTIIRRRMRQKFEFLTDDSLPVQASDEELAAYVAENRSKFIEETAYTFRQIYFNPERHALGSREGGQSPEGFVKARLDALRQGKAVSGDPSLLAESFDRASRRVVDGTFGRDFSRRLDDLATGEWQGPLRSGLGIHLIRLDARIEGKLPELAEIRPMVQREWAHQKRIEFRRQMNERLLKEYQVVIEWPQSKAASQSPLEGGES